MYFDLWDKLGHHAHDRTDGYLLYSENCPCLFMNCLVYFSVTAFSFARPKHKVSESDLLWSDLLRSINFLSQWSCAWFEHFMTNRLFLLNKIESRRHLNIFFGLWLGGEIYMHLTLKKIKSLDRGNYFLMGISLWIILFYLIAFHAFAR